MGVPQGYILEPVFFILHINLNVMIQNGHCVTYANDFLVIISSGDTEEMVVTSNRIRHYQKYLLHSMI